MGNPLSKVRKKYRLTTFKALSYGAGDSVGDGVGEASGLGLGEVFGGYKNTNYQQNYHYRNCERQHFSTVFVKIILVKFKITPALLWPIIVLLVAAGSIYFKPWQTKPQETVSVSASGKTQVTPNVAKITASIQSTNPNLDTARQQNEQKVASLVNALNELGIDQKDIKTEYISGNPGYEAQIQIYPPQRPNTNQLTTTLEITIRNFDNSDEVLKALTQNGATSLYGPNLTVDDDSLEQARSKARENAVENAKKKAQELAKLSGRKLGKAVKIQEQGDFGYPIPILAQGEADLKRQASQIQPGQNEVTISLQVDFSLK